MSNTVLRFYVKPIFVDIKIAKTAILGILDAFNVGFENFGKFFRTENNFQIRQKLLKWNSQIAKIDFTKNLEKVNFTLSLHFFFVKSTLLKVTSLVKPLVSRNFCQKVWEKISIISTLCQTQCVFWPFWPFFSLIPSFN